MKSSKPYLMIHEIRDWMFEIPLKDFILTFDDGLYSQYSYWDKLKLITTEKLFFISSNIISVNNTPQSKSFPPCQIAHKKFFETKCLEDYMNLSQIKELLADPLTTIGGHSHSHTNISKWGLKEQVAYIRSDTPEMLAWFEEHLGFLPKHFCFPYNFNNWIYSGLLKTEFNITSLYGEERQDIMQYENQICG